MEKGQNFDTRKRNVRSDRDKLVAVQKEICALDLRRQALDRKREQLTERESELKKQIGKQDRIQRRKLSRLSPPAYSQRDWEIFFERMALGRTYQTIGEHYDISAERARQIVRRQLRAAAALAVMPMPTSTSVNQQRKPKKAKGKKDGKRSNTAQLWQSGPGPAEV